MTSQPTGNMSNPVNGSRTVTESAKVPSSAVRPRFHLIYYMLAVFDLLTVSLGLYLINRITGIYTDSVAVNQVWANRLNDYSELSELAAALNAPGNDVFDSRDVEAESGRLASEFERFRKKAEHIRRDMLDNVDESNRQQLLNAFEAIPPAVDEMVAEARLIFGHFRNNEPREAGKRMAEMDRDYLKVNATLAELGRRVRAIQKSHFDEQTAAAASFLKFEFVIAGLIVVMVTGVTVYGHKLAKRMKEVGLRTHKYLTALAESESRLQGILDNTTAVVHVKDRNGKYILVNRRFEELFDIKKEEVVGRFVHDLFAKATADRLHGNDQKVLKERAPIEFEEVVPHADGDHTYISVKFPLYDHAGFPYGVCGISTDITERKKARDEIARHRDRLEDLVAERTEELEASHEKLRLQDRLAAIGTLAAGLGHDMNNVLFPVRCHLDALDATDLPRAAREQFTAVRKSIEYLQQLTDGLHLLSLDPDDPRASSEVTHLETWLPEVQPLVQTALPRQATLEIDVPDDLPPIGVAPHRLTQAIFNLVVNAGEASGERGTVRIWATMFNQGRSVRISVSDDGPGMNEDVRRQALDPFFTTKTRGLSTGLGLALVHGVVKSCGGTVEIDSAEHEGTTVILTLPVAPSPHRVTGEPRVAVVTVADRRISSFLTAMLKSSGYAVRAEPDPAAETQLWITDGESTSPRRARQYLVNGNGRRLILLGPSTNDWRGLDVDVVDTAGGVQAVRNAVDSVISSA